jgi:hypothetical protein
MLDHDRIIRIVREAVQAHAPPQSVRDVLSEPDTDLDGKDALRVTIVVTPEAIEKLKGDGFLDTLVEVQNRLRDAGEERFPIVWWSTEEELEDIGDS